ncbi:MAG: hypothetical protein Q8S08_10935, partial [Halomonas sp.]
TWSFVYQGGNDNKAEVTQDNADLSSSWIFQQGDNHKAVVSQTGKSNVSTIRQSGSVAYANHSQAGYNNSAVSTQW